MIGKIWGALKRFYDWLPAVTPEGFLDKARKEGATSIILEVQPEIHTYGYEDVTTERRRKFKTYLSYTTPQGKDRNLNLGRLSEVDELVEMITSSGFDLQRVDLPQREIDHGTGV